MRLVDLESMKKLKGLDLSGVRVGGETPHIERFEDQNGTIFEVDQRRGLFRVMDETDWQDIESDLH